MIRTDVWKIAIDALRSNKIKALLTTLGVVIGSACIVLAVTISLAGKTTSIAQIEGVGSNIVYAEIIRTGSQSTTLSDEICGYLPASRAAKLQPTEALRYE